ncbi:MAG TPA: sugar ABC transporter substrate-binding protein [Anaerolinea sp.]|nr:sugar ABC transporter substrate-binding protein [Anaerolinea sp.]
MTKRFAWHILVILLAAALIFSSCAPLIPTAEPVTLTFAFPRSDQAYYESLLPGFQQKNPNITISFKPFADGPQEPTDALIIPWALNSDSDFQKAGFLPLDSFMDQEQGFSAEDFYPGTLDLFKINNEHIAIPSGVDPWVMFYNKDLFDRYGVPYPQPGWTWSDFLALAQALRHPDDATYGYANMQTYTDSLLFLYQHGGALGDANGNPTLNTPENVEAVEWYTGLFRDYQVAPTLQQAQSDFGFARGAVYLGQVGGKVGMFMGQLSGRGGQPNDPVQWKFNWGVATLPRDQQNFTAAFYEGIGILKQSQHPEAAWKWVYYLSKQPHNRLVPARVSLANSPEYAQLVGDSIAQVGRDAMMNAQLVSNQNFGRFGGFLDTYFQAIDTLVNGDGIVQEELDKAQAEAEGQTQ